MINQGREEKVVLYKNQVTTDRQNNLLIADIKAIAADPMQFPTPDELSKYDGYPPYLFISPVEIPETATTNLLSENKGDDGNNLICTISMTLKAKEEKEIKFVVGYSFDKTTDEMLRIAKTLILQKTLSIPEVYSVRNGKKFCLISLKKPILY
jgi:hypothetical protein